MVQVDPRRDYFKKIREICDKFGVLLILDEVMTGFGRTGKYFAYEHYQTPPDLIALGKGIAGGCFPGCCGSNCQSVRYDRKRVRNICLRTHMVRQSFGGCRGQ